MLFAVVLTIHLFGQQKRYEGDYQIGTLKGHASFEYKLDRKDTILNGSFSMDNARLSQLLINNDSSFFITGIMGEGEPKGLWEFNFARFFTDTSQRADLIDFNYTVKVSGINHQIKGSIIDGKLDGKWTYILEEIANGRVIDSLFESEVYFRRGIPVNTLQIRNKNEILIGRFLEDGRPHDIWELYSRTEPKTLEAWHFFEGALLKIEQLVNTELRFTPVFGTPDSTMTQVPFDEKYFQAIQFRNKLRRESPSIFKNNLNDFLLTNIQYFGKTAGILRQVGSIDPFESFRVFVPHFPLDSSEILFLDSISKMNDHSQQLTDELLRNTQFNILKLSDRDVAFQFAVLENLQLNYLSKIETVTDAYKNGLFAHVSRKSLIDALWDKEELVSEMSVSYDWADSIVYQSYLLSGGQNLSKNKDGVEGLLHVTYTVGRSLSAIQEILEQKLQYRQFERQLGILEDSILLRHAYLNNLVDSLKIDTNEEVTLALNHIRESAKKELAIYSKIKTPRERLRKARVLIECMDALGLMSLQVREIPQKKQEIRNRYMDDVWNPFTATVMTEQVKKWIIEAYELVLLPHIYQTLEEKLSCENVGSVSSLMDGIHDRMFELRDEETRKLERKLKNEKDVQEVLSLMEIKLNTTSISQ